MVTLEARRASEGERRSLPSLALQASSVTIFLAGVIAARQMRFFAQHMVGAILNIGRISFFPNRPADWTTLKIVISTKDIVPVVFARCRDKPFRYRQCWSNRSTIVFPPARGGAVAQGEKKVAWCGRCFVKSK